MRCDRFWSVCIFVIIGLMSAAASDLSTMASSLKEGGYVIVFRHGATDESQQDVYPFKFNDTKAQRLLSEKGRETARAIGASMEKLGIPIGDVKTSKLNRAVETGRLISGKEVTTLDDLTDSGAGNPSSMANPTGGNAKVGRAIRELANTTPAAGTNTIIVTHKTNIADAFGKEWVDPKEGEAAVFKPASGSASLIARVPANLWFELPGTKR